MQARKPVVAGQFYPLERSSCIDQIEQCLQARATSESLPETIVAGIVPHAGWTFSGDLAAMVFSAIKSRHKKVDTFVIFGAAHGYFGESPAVYDKGSWMMPLGEIAVDEELAGALLKSGPAVSDIRAHSSEHSIEVQVPFVQYLFAGAKILPIIVPPIVQAVSLGTKVGDIIGREQSKRIVCIGSTDLTHYGPRYGFVPMGTGSEALAWASTVNDQQFIDLALKLRVRELLASAAENCNACGPGAAAAAIAAAKQLGKTEGLLLAHTNSNDVMLREMETASLDSVGYAAIVF
jgi:AmmeMemoRadiSam system protein B